jgi:hypothetical protein
MSKPSERSIEHDPPTAAGCVVLLLTLFVICGTAWPIVKWRDPDTGEPLPRYIAIFTPFLLGALFYGIVAGALNLIGVATVRKQEPQPLGKEALDEIAAEIWGIVEEERKKQSTEFFDKREPPKDR